MALSYVLDTIAGPEVITSRVSNDTIKSVSPGGFARVDFDLPRRLDQSRLPLHAQVRVYDTETGEQVGGGRVVEQGPNDDGTWKIACLGEGFAALQDIDEPYMVIDTNPESTSAPARVGAKVKRVGTAKRKLRKRRKGAKSFSEAGWSRSYKILTGAVSAEVRDGPAPNGSDVEGLLFQIPDGTTIGPSVALSAQFWGPFQCGQRLGGYIFRYLAGFNSSSYTVRSDALAIGIGAVGTEIHDFTMSSPPGAWKVHGTDFASTADAFQLRMVTGAAGTTTPNTWAHVRSLTLRSQMLDANGAVRPGSWHASTVVAAGPVFTDLIVRRCPTLKVGSVASGSHGFTQLAWYDPVTVQAILEELLEKDDTLTYHAWGADQDGRTPIHLTIPSKTVRYEVSPKFGHSGPAPMSDVYTRVVVTGVDENGYQRRYVLDRTPAGQPARSQTLSLDEAYTLTRAQQVAATFLDNHAAPPNSGTITVAEPVLDLATGRWVKPHSIRPGELCRVRGVQPSADTLNPEAKQDGVTIFRIVSNTYREGVATLELDTPAFNIERAIADLIAG